MIEAAKQKETGDAAMKAKDFDTAVVAYKAALKADDSDVQLPGLLALQRAGAEVPAASPLAASPAAKPAAKPNRHCRVGSHRPIGIGLA